MLIEQASDAIFVIDRNGNYLTVNSSACKMLGYTKREFLQMNYLDIIPAEDKGLAKETFNQIPGGETVINEY